MRRQLKKNDYRGPYIIMNICNLTTSAYDLTHMVSDLELDIEGKKKRISVYNTEGHVVYICVIKAIWRRYYILPKSTMKSSQQIHLSMDGVKYPAHKRILAMMYFPNVVARSCASIPYHETGRLSLEDLCIASWINKYVYEANRSNAMVKHMNTVARIVMGYHYTFELMTRVQKRNYLFLRTVNSDILASEARGMLAKYGMTGLVEPTTEDPKALGLLRLGITRFVPDLLKIDGLGMDAVSEIRRILDERHIDASELFYNVLAEGVGIIEIDHKTFGAIKSGLNI